MSGISFCNLPSETKELVTEVVKKKLQSLNCDFQLRKLKKLDPRFSASSYSSVVSESAKADDNFPQWASFLCETIESQRHCEGLFRKNASDVKLQEIKECFTMSKPMQLTGIEAAALLKHFLREMNPNLFSNHFTKLLIYIWQTFTKNSLRERVVLETLLLLPPSYLMLCKRLFHCFNFVARNREVNKMDSKNIAICVSMSLFALENTQVVTASALNELVEYLINNCYEIGSLTDEIHGLAIKSLERLSLSAKKKKVPMSEKIRRKAVSRAKKMTTDSASKLDSMSINPEPVVRNLPGRRLLFGDEMVSDFSPHTPQQKAISSIKRSDASLKLSPSYTSSDLIDSYKNGPVDRCASFSISEKPALPRSVSSVRKRKLKIDNSASSSLNEDFNEQSYNLSKLNFVTFDSTPEPGTTDSEEQDDSPAGSRTNTPLILNAASAAKATRYRLEMLNQTRREEASSKHRKDNSRLRTDAMNTSFMEPSDIDSEHAQSNLGCSTSQCTPKETKKSSTSQNSAVYITPRIGYEESKTPSSCFSASTPTQLLSAKGKTPLTRSMLCSITEDEVQRHFEFSPICGIENLDPKAAKNYEEQRESGEKLSEEFWISNFKEGLASDSLPLDEDDRRISFCLATDTHKNNFRSLKELWEATNSDD